MAKFNNLFSSTGEISELNSEEIYTKKISSNNYEGLPVSSPMNHGIVKVDGSSITINENGIISAKLVFDDEDMSHHINNEKIHLSPSDIGSISKIEIHADDETIHLNVDDRNDIFKIKNHISDTSTHLNENEKNIVSSVILHVNDSSVHMGEVEKRNMILHVSDSSLHTSEAEKEHTLLHIGNANIHINEAEKDSVTSHVNNSNIHISEIEKNSMTLHIGNSNIHISEDEKNSIAKFTNHISSTSDHFLYGEKETMISDINSSKEHSNTPHLSNDEVEYLKPHVLESWKHFDSAIQKEDVENLINSFSMLRFNSPNKIIITDEAGNPSLSSISSNFLKFIPNLKIPLVDYLAEYFQAKGVSNQTDLSEVNSHMQNTGIHISLEEKNKIYSEIELLKLDKGEELFAKKEDLIGFVNDEHTHSSLDVRHDERNLYSLLSDIIADISSMKNDIEFIKESVNNTINDVIMANGDLFVLKDDMKSLNEVINSYHPQEIPGPEPEIPETEIPETEIPETGPEPEPIL